MIAVRSISQNPYQYTLDGGQNWTAASLSMAIMGMSRNAQYVVAINNAQNALLYSTSVTGSFSAATVSGTTNNLSAARLFAMSNTGNGLLAFNSGSIYRTSNGGQSWVGVSISFVPFTIAIADEGGYAFALSSNSSTLRRSTDYGQSWTDVTLPFASSTIVCSSDGRTVLTSRLNNSKSMAISRDFGQTFSSSGFTFTGYGSGSGTNTLGISPDASYGVVSYSNGGTNMGFGYSNT
jgi:photosystem II stability/assembly factor-like uncharacterized protein